MSEEMTWTLPPLLREGVAIVSETGLYASGDEFLAEAVRTLLAARPDLRVALACKLYEHGAISLGRASELSGLNLEAMKQALHRHGVPRVDAESLSEIETMAGKVLELAGRSAS